MKRYISRPAQAVIISGPASCGKTAIAEELSKQILQTSSITDQPYIKVIEADSRSIGIEQVRTLEAFLKLKVPGSNTYNRAVIIVDGQLLTEEAQNALLKTLEEPPSGTLIFITTDNLQALLPTIRSRAQQLAVTIPSKQVIKDFFTESYSKTEVEQAYNLSGGLPGLMVALLGDKAHPLKQVAQTARQLLQAPQHERTLLIDSLSKDTRQLQQVLLLLQQMAHISLLKAAGPTARRWQTIYQAAYEASEALEKNAQPKLTVTDLALSL